MSMGTNTCRSCVHRQRWECGSKIIQYCRAIKSRRTFNGLKKIKCNMVACELYECMDGFKVGGCGKEGKDE